MHVRSEQFIGDSAAAVENKTLQKRLRVLNGFTVMRNQAFAGLKDGEALRDRARQIKENVINNLDDYLVQLEENVVRLGGTVHWARDGDEALAIVLELARKNKVTRVVKSKSMVTEEIELNDALEQAGIEAVETDLGEYIVQLAREKPSHILAPAVHKSKEDISELFAERLGAANLKEAKEMTAVARKRLREKFCTAEMGITGANFAIAETGTIVVVENEGNIRLSTSLPRIHVALMGIEKVIPSLKDLAVFLRILARSASGQTMSSYVSLISGPRRAGEVDGAEEFHLIILDNGRTRLLADEEMRESLYCLRCGACLNVCPVYKKIGGHAYGSVYSGPIGSIITPAFAGLEKTKDLPFASTLCGACREICPVRIDIPRILLRLRSDWSEGKADGAGPPLREKLALKLWALGMRHALLYSLMFRLFALFQGPLLEDGKLKRLPFAFGGWTENRDFPALARRSFRSMWRDDNWRTPAKRRGDQ
ncbi:MAG TPA: LutB/LldF family L-lactate oxidation iron-sulfur protein [Blastocatellia bacterium]|nr:LutB/LldF family L-lactate oxidation iron-sulfur protein [Blastocatellia bacterium]